MLVSISCSVNSFLVLDPSINFSDHVPLMMNLCVTDADRGDDVRSTRSASSEQSYLRWDKANRTFYYCYTGSKLEPLAGTIDSTLQAYDFDINTFPANSIPQTLGRESVTSWAHSSPDRPLRIPCEHRLRYSFWLTCGRCLKQVFVPDIST